MTDRRVSRKRTLYTHVCDLPRSSGSNLPRLPPNARFYNRWRRNLQKLVLVSARHPLTQSILRSQAAVAFEKRRHSRSAHRWMIHPCSTLRFHWDVIMTVTLLYIFVTFPYIACFRRIGKGDESERWNVIYPAYVICIVDIFLNFITGFVSPDGRDIFLDAALVTRHYARGYFLVDLISSVPYTWFYPTRILPPGPDSNSALLVVEFLPVLKMIRVPTVRRNLRYVNMSFAIPQTQESIIWLVILTLLIFHWSGCVSYVFPYVVMHAQGKRIENVYYISTKLYDEPDWKIYLVYMHIGLSNLIGSSFVDFDNFGILDMIIRYVILLLGKGYAIYLIVIILQIVESSAKSELKYQQMMHQVKEYIRERKLPRYLQDKLISYYEYRYQGNFFKETVIADTISHHLRQEILLYSHYGLFDTVIFQKLPRAVFSELLNLLRSVMYLENDVIYKADAFLESDCMYFIANGTVALITLSGKEICHLHDGDHFGEAGLIYSDQRRTESVIALETCELFRLNRRDFKRLFAVNSEFYDNLKDIARERLKRIKELDEQKLE